jgi:FMN phosphatase YigB (HAD superfamily)
MERKRTDHTQIPSSTEINEIVAAEAKRQKPASKIGVRYADFSKIIELYRSYNLNSSIFEYSGQTTQQILDAGARDIPKLIELIINDSRNRPLLNGVYDYLAEEDKLSRADFIFVFGSKGSYRVKKAIELHKDGLGEKIIFSGHVPSYADKSAKPEAEIFAQLAADAGIPENAIMVEPESITIPDNIRRSLNMLDEKSITYTSFILVNSPYSQRRGWCVLKKYTEDSIKILRANSQTKPEYSKDMWFTNQDGIAVILGEYFKLRNAVSFDDA